MTAVPRCDALARALLERCIARSGPEGLVAAFEALAPLACLDQALQAGQPLDRTLPIVLGALRVAVGAGGCRLLLRVADGGFVRVRQDGSSGAETPLPVLSGLTGAVMTAGVAQAFAGDALAGMAPAVDWMEARPPRSLLCAPLPGGVGVLQVFDAPEVAVTAEGFAAADVVLAEQACAAIGALLAAGDEACRLEPALALDGASGPDAILARILAVALRVLDADRGWILVHDPAADVLRSSLSEGLGRFELQLSAQSGVAATAFRDGALVNIAEAYRDPRFNPALDRMLGYRTRSVLCVPVETAEGRRLGVLQMVNHRGGPFGRDDEENARALAAQVGVTMAYGALFEQLSRMKATNESMLRSLSNGVLTVGLDGEVGFVNGAALRIIRAEESQVLGRRLAAVFDELNAWVMEAVDEVRVKGGERQMPNSEFYIASTDEWVPVNLAILPLLDARGAATGFMLVFEDLQREQELRRTMSRYVSNDVIDQMMTGDGALLSGAIQPATTLFSDIRGFSQLSEALGATGTVALLNEYFSYMEDVVANRSGIIDKYIGDAVMAVFGTPFPGEQDAENAVQAAADMLQVLGLLNASRAEAGLAQLRIGIGLASGPVLMGNIGSPKRMDFTVIGDPVNLASRLESATKQYGADILLDGATMGRLRPGRRIRRVDVVRVVGQEQPTEIFELLDHRAEQWGAGYDAAMAEYAAGLERHAAGDWAASQARFVAAAGFNPLDRAAVLLAERCGRFVLSPPERWDGAFRLTEK